jgi:hypothetical protein
VTAAQVREVATRIISAGHWQAGDPDILVVFDSGYDLTRLAWLLRGLPVEVAGRLRSDQARTFPRQRANPAPTAGRWCRHRAVLKLAEDATWPAPAVTTVTETTRFGTATAMAWGQLHQRLTSSATRPLPTGGPGWSSPATPSSASPAPWPKTCACPGSSPARPGPPRVSEHPPDAA